MKEKKRKRDPSVLCSSWNRLQLGPDPKGRLNAVEGVDSMVRERENASPSPVYPLTS